MRELARAIRNRLDSLTEEYDRCLQIIKSYAELPDAVRLDASRQDLNLIAACLEAGDYTQFVQFIQTRAGERLEQGFEIGDSLQALDALEETLLPLVADIETARFLWRVMTQTRTVVSRQVEKALRASQAELEGRNKLLTITNATVQALQESRDYQTVVARALDQLMDYTDCSIGVLYILDKDADCFRLAYHRGTSEEMVQRGQTLARKGSLTGVAADRKDVVVTDELVQDDRLVPEVKEALLKGGVGGTVILVPLIFQEQVSGVINLVFKEKHLPTTQERETLRSIGRAMGSAIANVQYVAQIETEIVERRQLEQQVQASERKFHEMVDRALVGIFRTTPTGQIVEANPAVLKTLHFDSLEQANQVGLLNMYVDTAERQRLLVALRQGPVAGFETRFRRGDGEIITISIGARLVLDEKGAPQFIEGTLEDITGRKRLEQQLQESLARRGRQVQTSTEIAQEIATAPALDELFRRVVTLIKERFGYYHAQLFRYEPALNAVLLVTGYGEAGRKMLAAGHRLEIGRSVVGAVAATGKSILATNVAQDKDWRPDPYLPDTQGELAVPIKLRDEVLGILDVQSAQAGALTQDDQLLLEGLCGQIAIAIEGRRVEDALREREEDLNAMLEYSPEAIGVVNTQTGLFENVNFAAERLYGLNREDLVKVGPAQMSPEFQPDGRPSLDAAMEKIGEALHGGTPVFEWIHLNAAGQQIPCEVRLAGLTGARSHLVRFSVTDITERKRAEEELRATRQLSSIIDFLPDATFVIDRDKKIIAWNRAAEEMTGVRKEDIIGQGDYAYAVPFYGERRPITIDLLDAEDSEFKAKYEYVHKQGNTLYTEVFVQSVFGGRGADLWVTASSLLDSQGNPIGAIESIRDVTERKRLERQLQESLERRGRQVQTSTEIAQEIATAPALDELFRRVVALTKERFGYYHAQIFRYEPALNEVVLVAGYGKAGQKMLALGHHLGMGRGVVGAAAATGRPILAADVAQDQDWRPNPNLPETRGELAVPIKLRDYVLGILDVQSDQAGALTQDDQLLLEGLCGQIAIAIEDTRLRQEMEERLRELDSMYRTTSREGWQAFRQSPTLPTGYRFDRISLQPAEDLWMPEIEQAAKQGMLATPSGAGEGQASGAAVAPLAVRGEIIGALGVYDNPQSPLSQDDLALIESVSDQVALALENARLFEDQQRAHVLLGTRVKELDCLNDMGRKINETPDVSEFLHWAAEHIPQAMQYPDLCKVGIEFGGLVYGAAEALDLPCQMVAGLYVGNEAVGQIYIAYTQRRDFLNEESALLGDIVRRVSSYIENRHLIEQTQTALAEVEATHRRYLREQWETYLGSAVAELGGYMDGPAGLTPILEEHVSPGEPQSESRNLKSETLSVPIKLRGEPIGSMEFYNEDAAHTWSEDERALAETLADQAALALENARLFEDTQSRAKREHQIGEVTAKIRASMDMETILRTTAEELARALNLSRARIRLGAGDQDQEVA